LKRQYRFVFKDDFTRSQLQGRWLNGSSRKVYDFDCSTDGQCSFSVFRKGERIRRGTWTINGRYLEFRNSSGGKKLSQEWFWLENQMTPDGTREEYVLEFLQGTGTVKKQFLRISSES
ncbi:MAG: hypothetical protein ABEK50_12925, partial [bacterium]